MPLQVWAGVIVAFAALSGWMLGMQHFVTLILLVVAAYCYGRGDGRDAAARDRLDAKSTSR